MRTKTLKFLSILTALAVVAIQTTAVAAGPKLAKGKIVSFVKKTGGGTLTIKSNGKTLKFTVDKKTICGYQKGQSGGPLPSCNSLTKYKGYKVNVAHKGSLATQVTVVYPPPKK
jgi:hypothetical protein